MGLATMPNLWAATAWQTASDIKWQAGDAGAGDTIQLSSFMDIDTSTLPAIALATLHVEFTQQRTSAGAGVVNSWVLLKGITMYEPVEQGDLAPSYVTGYVSATSTARLRRIFIAIPCLQVSGGYGDADKIKVRVGAKGDEGTVEWIVSGIKSRLLYLPVNC